MAGGSAPNPSPSPSPNPSASPSLSPSLSPSPHPHPHPHPHALKAELARLGLKCGGAPAQRAERLWQTRGVALADLQQAQPSLFAKPKAANTSQGSLFRPSLGPLLPGVERRVGQKSVP